MSPSYVTCNSSLDAVWKPGACNFSNVSTALPKNSRIFLNLAVLKLDIVS